MTDGERSDQALAAAVRKRVPQPRSEFAGPLRARLVELHAASRRPRRLGLLIVAYVLVGTVLLIVAALGIAGKGPFG
jgi:hypothetical protein